MNINLNTRESFESRHNGPSEEEKKEMLNMLPIDSLDSLIEETVPASIRLENPLNLPEPKTEYAYLKDLKEIASKNTIANSFIGRGYYGTILPGVIQRNVLENPAWYTAYTPYQPEIAQGRLEALINFQTVVTDLTGMEIANASLLDEATAAAEAVSLLYASRSRAKKVSNVFLVDQHVFPQVLEVLKTRSEPIGVELKVVDLEKEDITAPEIFGVYFY